MKRVIVDFKKLNRDILELLVSKFPDGYADNDIITFRNADYELIEAVEVKTEDITYLVKISKHLADTMEKFHVNDDVDDVNDDDELLSPDSDLAENPDEDI